MVVTAGALPCQAAPKSPKPIIASVAVEADAGTVLLRGFNFPENPKVYMGTDDLGMNLLQVRSSSLNTIEAVLKSIPSGVILVTVLEGGADTPESEAFFPKSLPVNSPVFADAIMYEIRRQ